MCKALSHDIEISQVRLLRKSGGKRDFAREPRKRDPGKSARKGKARA
jgi:hypothetical protein